MLIPCPFEPSGVCVAKASLPAAYYCGRVQSDGHAGRDAGSKSYRVITCQCVGLRRCFPFAWQVECGFSDRAIVCILADPGWRFVPET